MDRGLTYLQMGKSTEANADFAAARKLYPEIALQIDAEIAKVHPKVTRK